VVCCHGVAGGRLSSLAWTEEKLFSSKKQDWGTPLHAFEYFNERFKFQLDAAATAENALCSRFITPEQDALAVPWEAQTVWLNPPYGRGIGAWMQKAYEEGRTGKTVGVLAFARTDTAWWHDYAMRALSIYLIRGRLKFIGDDGEPGNSATAPSCFIVFGKYPPLGGPRFIAVEL
jgi:phage N-6-adenine-methyltransferase